MHRFGLQGAKIASIPLDQGYFKYREDETIMAENDKYQMTGALLYIVVNSRPDIAASVTILISLQHMTRWTELKRIVRYLKGTKGYELKLGRPDGSKKLISFLMLIGLKTKPIENRAADTYFNSLGHQ